MSKTRSNGSFEPLRGVDGVQLITCSLVGRDDQFIVEGVDLVVDLGISVLAEQDWPPDLAGLRLAALDVVTKRQEARTSSLSTASLPRPVLRSIVETLVSASCTSSTNEMAQEGGHMLRGKKLHSGYTMHDEQGKHAGSRLPRRQHRRTVCQA
jgi:hypothetical protein